MNKLADQYYNIYYHSINKKPINADFFALNEKIEANLQTPKFKVNDRVRITKYTNIFSKSYTKEWVIGIFIVNSVFKLIH